MNKKEKINKNGITLIALVITIIVLLILAGVTISALTGDNGILNNASLAKISTEFANYKEEVEIYKANKLLENLNFNEETLSAGKTSLKYEGKPENEEGNIKTIINDLEDKYLEKFIIINGTLYLMSTGETSNIEIKAAENTGIEIMPYEITEEGELVSSNVNLGLQGGNGTITIPEIVTSIATGAFRDVEGLKTIIIPGTVKTIGSYAFSGNPTLENVIMEEGVETIGDFAFQDCTGLKEIKIANTVSSIGSTCFGGCTALTTINFPTSLKEIPYRMLSECDSIEEINIPEGIITIDRAAFESCDKLKAIYISSTVVVIGDLAFSGDPIEIIEVSENSKSFKIENNSLISYDGKKLYHIIQNNETTINIPPLVEIITSNVLSSLKTNTILNIGENVKEIGSILDTKIKYINVAEKNQTYASVNGSLYNKDITRLIRYCGNESIISLPNTVKNIGIYAFSLNKSLQEVVLPEGLESIEAFAFTQTNITKINFPDSLTTIDSLTFGSGSNIDISISENNQNFTIIDGIYVLNKSGNKLITISKNLENYTIPDTVEIIGTYAFYAKPCTEIILPIGIKTIEVCAFDIMTNLKKIEIPSTVETIEENAFSRCNSLTQIIINKEKDSIPGAAWGCPYGTRAVIWNG